MRQFGCVVHAALRGRGALVLPRYDAARGRLHLGFLLAGVIGIVAALAVDGDWLTAFFAAVAVPHVAETIADRVNGRRRRHGGTASG